MGYPATGGAVGEDQPLLGHLGGHLLSLAFRQGFTISIPCDISLIFFYIDIGSLRILRVGP